MLLFITIMLAVAGAIIVGGARGGRRTLYVAAAVTGGAFVALLVRATAVLDGRASTSTVAWVPSLGLDFTLRLDGFALFMGLIVTGVGVLVFTYSAQYFRSGSGDRPDVHRIAGLLLAFAASMLGLVLADGFFTLFVFWELTSITSFFLIGIDDRKSAAREAAQRALLVTGAGGLALLAGLVLLGQAADTSTISGLVAAPPSGTTVTVALVLVLIGAFTKSAQFPFHFWLPGAMAAPTPVSAYLHSATMVKAGIVLIARLAPAFGSAGPWRPMIVAAGGTSMILGGLRALREHDAKLVLAYGTVSQLGLITVLVGVGTPKATYAGIAILLAHSLFKACLFLAVGAVDHATNTRDLRKLAGLGRQLPVLAAIVGLAALSMAAIAPTFGFVAKEVGISALIDPKIGLLGPISLVVVTVGSALTVAYSLRLFDGLFIRGVAPRSGRTITPIDPERVHPPGVTFLAAPALLAGLSLMLGMLAAPVGDLLAKVAASLDESAASGTLVLWPGFVLALAISIVTWFLGVGIAAVVRRHGREGRPTIAPRIYLRLYDGLLSSARRITAVIQSGSLPVYLGVILACVLAALVYGGIRGYPGFTDVPFSGTPLQPVLVAATALLALGIPRARRRFTAALLLGGTGYGLALIFLVHGAPDLAVTQFLVETLIIVVFLLVLRHLPDRFEPPPSWAPRALRIRLSVAVGLMVTMFALAVGGVRHDESVGRTYLERSVEDAGGRNVVNVTLVDFRGFDTLGEITVLAVAAIGVVNLVGVARREQRRKHLEDGVPVRSDMVRGSADPAARGSVVLSTTARGLAPVLGLLAVYLTARGHNAPGGGFAGGLVLASALILGYLADGRRSLEPERFRPLHLTGLGLAIAVAVAAAPLVVGGSMLESAIWKLDVPGLGPVKLVSSSFFDVGVMLLVTGVVLAAVGAFARAAVPAPPGAETVEMETGP